MNKTQAMAMYDNKCAKCGKTLNADRHAHFHHERSYNKKHNMSDMFNKYSYEATIEELHKCILLCDDCHRAFHKEVGAKCFKKQTRAYIAR